MHVFVSRRDIRAEAVPMSLVPRWWKPVEATVRKINRSLAHKLRIRVPPCHKLSELKAEGSREPESNGINISSDLAPVILGSSF